MSLNPNVQAPDVLACAATVIPDTVSSGLSPTNVAFPPVPTTVAVLVASTPPYVPENTMVEFATYEPALVLATAIGY
jgi:hypothetical protein